MTMKQQILDKVEECFQIAERYFNREFERPKNIIFKRNGTTGGYSHYSKRELMFQLDLAEHHGDDFLNRTVPHELAHYVQRAVYGYYNSYGKKVMPHGREWKSIMRNVFRLEPSRCHSYDTTVTKTRKGFKQKRFQWKCDCRTFELTTRMHNACLTFKRQHPHLDHYNRVCKRCRGNIHPVKIGHSFLQVR